MYVLGINAYHGGASAALIRDGELLAAVEEERFSRVKYDSGFPVRAIQYVLAEAHVDLRDVDHVGISRKPSANLLRKALYTLRRRPSLSLVRDRLSKELTIVDLKSDFCSRLGLSDRDVRAQFHNVEHHRAHMASAFFVSPFESAAVLSIDEAGDFVTTMWGYGESATVKVADEIRYPHSIGMFYTAVSQWLGFPKYGDEGKTMGLAPLGQPRHLDKMRKLVRLQSDGTFELDLDYFRYDAEGAGGHFSSPEPSVGTMFSDNFVRLFGEPRVPRSELTSYHQDVAASMQVMLERTELALVRKLQRDTGSKALCMAGGVALNSAFNGKVLPSTDFEDIFIQPAAGDAGTSLGVCYHIYHQVLGRPRTYVMRSPFTGPQYSSDQVESALEQAGARFQTLEQDALVDRVVEIVASGGVVGWFQGRMEWGPRALGNRSIIADPRRADMKEILNSRVKHREAFRPFAPSILAERVGDYFEQTYPDPFMIKIYNVVPEMRDRIPAVTHVDGTGRLQTVDQATFPLYWRLIKKFDDETGVPVVLNTSFNENEPIVCTPEEGISVFSRTRMDALAIGPCLAEKE